MEIKLPVLGDIETEQIKYKVGASADMGTFNNVHLFMHIAQDGQRLHCQSAKPRKRR